MSDCLFCNIVEGEMDTDIVYDDDKVVAFEDINPQAPVHILIVPKKHIETISDIEADDYQLVGHIYKVANKLSEKYEIADEGFRIVSNCKDNGGQTVYHIHFHLLGGRQFQWPPG